MARLFVPSDHYFEIGGAVRAEYFIEGSNELEAKTTTKPTTWNEVPLATFDFRRDDPDKSVLIERLRAHKPILA